MQAPKPSHLRLVVNRDSTPPHAPVNSTNRLLRAVLDARLSPDVTVEQFYGGELPGADPTAIGETFVRAFSQLRAAGLDLKPDSDDLPGGIVLTDPEAFKARFPELAAAVPVMLAHEGVQPLTAGLPRRRVAVTTLAEVPSDAALARQLILDYNLGSKTIREAIAAADGQFEEPMGAISVHIDNMLLLQKLGIQLLKNGIERGLDTDSYATLWDPKPMKRRIPALKKMKVELVGLSLY